MSFTDICTGCGRPVFVFARDKYLNMIQEICLQYNVDFDVVMGASREQNATWARQAAYHALHLVGLSSSQIGRLLGRDHSTVLHGIKCHKERQARGENLYYMKKRGGER